jgi:hypothetical protein
LALAALYGGTGRKERCQTEVKEILRISPGFSLKLIKEMIPTKDQTIVDDLIDILRNAGLPD